MRGFEKERASSSSNSNCDLHSTLGPVAFGAVVSPKIVSARKDKFSANMIGRKKFQKSGSNSPSPPKTSPVPRDKLSRSIPRRYRWPQKYFPVKKGIYDLHQNKYISWLNKYHG